MPASDSGAGGTGEGTQGDCGQRQQCNRQGGRRNQQNREQQPTRAPKFEGRCDELSGHIYEYASTRQAVDMYTKTTREICEYVGRTYKYGADTKMALETLAVPTFPHPNDPPENASRTEVRMWEKAVDEAFKRKNLLAQNLQTAYSLIYGQCTDALGVTGETTGVDAGANEGKDDDEDEVTADTAEFLM